MPICLAVPKETLPGERRVALTPDTVGRSVRGGYRVVVQSGAGIEAYHSDDAYRKAGAEIVAESAVLYRQADVVVAVQPPSSETIGAYRRGAVHLGFLQPHRQLDTVRSLCEHGVTSFAMELVPRISRAQAIDALSSQATVAGYKAVLIAADLSSRFFPMLTTAAGTIRPAKVLVIGAGVAGLQAIATARRLGAVVEAYDVRHAAREQVESLGAKFIQVDLDAETEGGYARELTADEKEREQVLLSNRIRESDIVVTTAQIPGRDAPRLVSARVVQDMKPGAVIVDLAAESGGNCELTRAGEQVRHGEVLIYGPINVPSMLAVHASEMYSRNIFNFLALLGQGEEGLTIDWQDEILAGSVVTHDGEVRHEPTHTLMEGQEI
jgi:NAD(P) transhydrogenase subunit alpha